MTQDWSVKQMGMDCSIFIGLMLGALPTPSIGALHTHGKCWIDGRNRALRGEAACCRTEHPAHVVLCLGGLCRGEGPLIRPSEGMPEGRSRYKIMHTRRVCAQKRLGVRLAAIAAYILDDVLEWNIVLSTQGVLATCLRQNRNAKRLI
nr:hypothetical protein CFP56_50368 [Quercus suber]